MRLSQLQKIVDSIKASANPDNPDPDVSFYMVKEHNYLEKIICADEKKGSACAFVDFEMDTSVETVNCKVTAVPRWGLQTRQATGDFTIPIYPVSFYKV